MKHHNDILNGVVVLIAFVAMWTLSNNLRKEVDVGELDLNIGNPPGHKSSGTPSKKTTTDPDSSDSSDEAFLSFEKFRKKALLSKQELIDKENLLSDPKTLRSVESYLTELPGPDSLKDHMLAIDLLEQSIAWRENPSRRDAIETLEHVLQFDNEKNIDEKAKRLLVGDKIELFTILAQEDPLTARSLLETTKNVHLRDVLNYAFKRLNLGKIMLEAK